MYHEMRGFDISLNHIAIAEYLFEQKSLFFFLHKIHLYAYFHQLQGIEIYQKAKIEDDKWMQLSVSSKPVHINGCHVWGFRAPINGCHVWGFRAPQPERSV